MILVTGGTGLIGSHLLLALLRKGEKIRATYRSKYSVDKVKKLFKLEGASTIALFDQIEWVEADLLDLPALTQAFKGVQKVYHAAALVSFDKRDARALMNINVTGTQNVVNLCLQNSIQKMAYVSSVASLGQYADGKCTDEEALWQYQKNISNYSVSKYYAENEVWRASAEGLNVVIVNPVTVIGYSDWNNSSSMIIKKVSEGLPYYPEGTNGYVGVKDVVKALVLLMDGDTQSERFLLVAENLSFKDLFDQLAKALEAKTPTWKISKGMAKIAMFFDQLKALLSNGKPALTSDSIEAVYAQRCFSATKIETILGFKFEPIKAVIADQVPLYLKAPPNVRKS